MNLRQLCGRRRWTTALLAIVALWPALASAAGPDNVLFVGWGQKVDNLDPQTSRGNRNWWVLAELYDTLTVLPEQSLQAAPQLAESWTVSPDGKEYVFKIRKGVKFSTGNELNAHAVKFALDRLHTIGLGPLYMTRDVYNRTDVIDDYTVKTVLNFPYPVWLAILSQPAVTGIGDPKVIREKCGEPVKGQKCDWLSNNSAGAGAYVVEEFKPNDRVVLAKNPRWWGGTPKWDGVVISSIPETTTRVAELLTGGVDIAVNVPPEDIARLNDNKGTRAITFDIARNLALHVRTGKDRVTGDPRARAS